MTLTAGYAHYRVQDQGRFNAGHLVTVTDPRTGDALALETVDGTTLGNPVTADSNGMVDFFARAGAVILLDSAGGNTRVESTHPYTPDPLTLEQRIAALESAPAPSGGSGNIAAAIQGDWKSFNKMYSAGAIVRKAGGLYVALRDNGQAVGTNSADDPSLTDVPIEIGGNSGRSAGTPNTQPHEAFSQKFTVNADTIVAAVLPKLTQSSAGGIIAYIFDSTHTFVGGGGITGDAALADPILPIPFTGAEASLVTGETYELVVATYNTTDYVDAFLGEPGSGSGVLADTVGQVQYYAGGMAEVFANPHVDPVNVTDSGVGSYPMNFTLYGKDPNPAWEILLPPPVVSGASSAVAGVLGLSLPNPAGGDGAGTTMFNVSGARYTVTETLVVTSGTAIAKLIANGPFNVSLQDLAYAALWAYNADGSQYGYIYSGASPVWATSPHHVDLGSDYTPDETGADVTCSQTSITLGVGTWYVTGLVDLA